MALYFAATAAITQSPHFLQALGTVQIQNATPESELTQVLAILGALAAENDKSTLLAVLQGLSPQVLADCVIANMAYLPAASTVSGAGNSAGLAGLMQVGSPPHYMLNRALQSLCARWAGNSQAFCHANCVQ